MPSKPCIRENLTASLLHDVGVVVFTSVVEAVEGLEPAVGGRVSPVAETQVPLANHVGGVP